MVRESCQENGRLKMFLLSRDVIMKHNYLGNQISISPMKDANLIRTFYYFRAGDTLKILSPKEQLVDLEKMGKGILPGNAFGLIKSREHFVFTSTILSIFGNVTDLIKKGLQIINSPSIDPGFEGHLTLGIKNNTDADIELKYEDIIGKLLFFNIADTYVSAKMLIEEAGIEKKIRLRKEDREF